MKILEDVPPQRWRFRDLLADPVVSERWEKVRRWFFLRESTYDMTKRCNIRCEGCYYFEGEKQHSDDDRELAAWRALFEAERDRGVTFVVLAGAEPALVPDRLRVAHEVLPLGAIATNGLKPIPAEIGYRLHISVWGDDQRSLLVRGAKRMLERQLEAYAGDPRAVFVYTFTRQNVADAEPVVARLADAGCKVTFNMFSSPEGYTGELRHTPASLAETRSAMRALLEAYPDTVLFSDYSAVAHTSGAGLHDLYGCSYPRRSPPDAVGLGATFRQYRTDLTWDRAAACCVPDTDCADCRHYAAGSAVVTARLARHAVDPTTFRSWLDYVDTYLAVWVAGYTKGPNLQRDAAPPPGHGLAGHPAATSDTSSHPATESAR